MINNNFDKETNAVFIDGTAFSIEFNLDKFTLSHHGFCPVCQAYTLFSTQNVWFRNFYVCTKCGTAPRDRQLFKLLYKQDINFNEVVLEFAPSNEYIKRIFRNYTGSHYFPDEKPGKIINGFRNENIENTTYHDNTFDFVIHEDVFEHIFHPIKAIKEIYRILKVGGKSIFCFPIYENLEKTIVRAKIDEHGEITHILEPDYHGNPIDKEGSLVVYEYGCDIIEIMFNSLPMQKVKWTHVNKRDPAMGINGKFLDCFLLEKIS